VTYYHISEGKLEPKAKKGFFMDYTDADKVMQSYPVRALDRRFQVDWARDEREGPRVLMSLRLDLGPWAKYEPTYLCTY